MFDSHRDCFLIASGTMAPQRTTTKTDEKQHRTGSSPYLDLVHIDRRIRSAGHYLCTAICLMFFAIAIITRLLEHLAARAGDWKVTNERMFV
jgi:hypothetical protein